MDSASSARSVHKQHATHRIQSQTGEYRFILKSHPLDSFAILSKYASAALLLFN
jgi:hypothetical protein